jgi:hypothetical protein
MNERDVTITDIQTLSSGSRLTDLTLVRPVDFEADYHALSYRFHIRSNVESAGDVLTRLFKPFRLLNRLEHPSDPAGVYEMLHVVRDDNDDREFELIMDGHSMQRSRSPGNMLDWIISDITERATGLPIEAALVHASAASRSNLAVVMPAPPEHGKTTTVAALVRVGWDLLTDEVAVISTSDGLVRPFPRPLLISAASMAVLPGLRENLPDSYEVFRHVEYHVAPDDLRPDCISPPARLGFVIFPSYSEGSETRLTPMPRGEAAMELLHGCFNLSRLGRGGFEHIVKAIQEAYCYRMSVGSIDGAIGLIEDLFEQTA